MVSYCIIPLLWICSSLLFPCREYFHALLCFAFCNVNLGVKREYYEIIIESVIHLYSFQLLFTVTTITSGFSCVKKCLPRLQGF